MTDAKTGLPINAISVTSALANGMSADTPDDPALEDGFYWVFQPLAAPSETVAITYGGGVYLDETVDVPMSRNVITMQDIALDTLRTFLPLFLR